MRRLAAALAVCLAAGGCASALPLAGGAGAGAGVCFGASLAGDVKSADTVLSADAPLKQIACDLKPIKPRGPVSQAFVDTYCANIPTTVLGAGLTWAKVLAAMAAAERAQEAAP